MLTFWPENKKKRIHTDKFVNFDQGSGIGIEWVASTVWKRLAKAWNFCN